MMIAFHIVNLAEAIGASLLGGTDAALPNPIEFAVAATQGRRRFG